MDLDKVTCEAMSQVIAKQILDGLDTDKRDALLQKSIEAVIKDYSFRRAIEETVCEKATEKARELMNTEKFSILVSTAISEGANEFIRDLREAMSAGMSRLLVGDKDGGSSHGLILEALNKVRRERKRE